MWEIKQRKGETTWDLMRRFKDEIRKLSYLINLNHQINWFIKVLLSLTRTPLTQQKIDTLQDALEKAMKVEAMAGYLQEFKGGAAAQDPSILGLQHQIASLMENLKDIQPIRPARPNVWCTHCLMEGHVVTECPILQGRNMGAVVAGTQGTPLVGELCR